mgnify:CR=1 FL=1
MINLLLRAAGLAALALLASCGGNSDNAPTAAPSGFSVSPGDSSVVVTWTMEPGQTYWIFSAAAPSITRDNYRNFPAARITQPAVSPQIITGLSNGTTYSFLINATQGGSPSGPSTTSIAAVPRLAGDAWTLGTPLSVDLNAVGIGGGRYLAVGNGGAIFTRPAAIDGTWTAATSGVTANLNGLAGSGALAVAVGDNGTIISTTNATDWTARTSGTTVRLNDAAAVGATLIAVGDNGTLLRSLDAGVNWAAVTSGTTANLTGASAIGGTFFVLGANGTLLTSVDGGGTWVAQTSGTTATLRDAVTGGGRTVIVGDGGTILTGTDLVTWTPATSTTTQALRRVVAGTRFVASGANGVLLASADGLTWTAVNSGTTADLRGLVYGVVLDYLAVGTGGVNAISR